MARTKREKWLMTHSDARVLGFAVAPLAAHLYAFGPDSIGRLETISAQVSPEALPISNLSALEEFNSIDMSRRADTACLAATS